MRKAITGLSSLVALILILLTAFVLFSYTDLFTKTLSMQHKNEISVWVSTTAAKLSATGGYLQKTGHPPVASLYEKPIEFKKEEDFQKNANRIIAEAMLNCWESFGSGDLHFLGNDYSASDIFCFPCAQIKISQEIKSKYTSLNEIGFSDFLSKPIAKNGPTYSELFSKGLVYDPTIPSDGDLYIVFMTSKGDFWQRLGATTSSGSMPVLGFYRRLISPGTSTFFPTLILAQPQGVSKACNP